MDQQLELKKNIFYRHFNLPTNFPVIGLLGDSWIIEHAPITRLHFHNCFEIGYLYQGSGTFYLSDQAMHFEAPCLVLTPPNVPHMHMADENHTCRCKWLYVDPLALLNHLSRRLSNHISEYQRSLNGSACVLSQAEYPGVYATAGLIIDELESAQPHHHHIVRELFSSLFLMLLRTFSGASQDEGYLASQLGCLTPAVAYIAENYMNEIAIDHLAQLCHVSTSHFRRLFKKVLGWSPLDYVQIMRIDRACALLYNCEYSVTEVSLQVGYPSPSSFNRQFHRIHGVSPSQWRQKMRSEENPTVTAYFDSLPTDSDQFFPQDYLLNLNP